jgi:putative endonuclease
LDIVALDGEEIVFAEVKTIREKANFTPSGNLSNRQRRRNFNAAHVYLKAMDICGHPARFDLIEVVCGRFFIRRITHQRNYLPPLPPREL